MDEVAPVLAFMAGLLVLSGVFSSAETALFSLGASDLRRLRESGTSAARIVDRLLSDKRRLLVTVLLANLAVNILYFNMGALVGVRLARGGSALSALVPPLVLAGVVLFGEMVPKTLAVHRPMRVALLVSYPLLWTERVLAPPRVVLSGLADMIARLVMGRREAEGQLTPDELDSLLQLSAREGQLADDEFAWLQALLDLQDTPVREVMVPRVEVATFELPGTREDFLSLASGGRRNKVPVHRGGIDRLEGYLEVREVLARPDASLEELVRPLVFVPENAPVAAAADRMMEDGLRLLVAVDEYGGTAGLLTREDVVEAVVGDLADEFDDPQPPVVQLGPGDFDVSARLGVQAWRRLVGPAFGELPVATVGGLVTALLGRVPRPGDEVRAGPLLLRVRSVRRRRAHRIEVRTAREAVP